MRDEGEEKQEYIEPLFETQAGKGRAAHRFYCFTVAVGILSVWAYRLAHVTPAWFFMFSAELIFGLYWILTQAARWRVLHHRPFPDTLSIHRYKNKLPRMDIFVCTADHNLEPPLMVINTVLSLMSYNYPPEKLAVYLSDDGCSKLTFYTLLEASKFSKHWIPFCKKHNIQPRAPEIYFARSVPTSQCKLDFQQEWTQIKKLYDDMKSRIESASMDGCNGKDDLHKGFSEWNSGISKHDHPSIVEILIEGWNHQVTDVEGNRLPALVYLSREKRPGWGHNFKAGAMNSLIRVSSEITNAPIILNLDCDMYSNDPNSIHDVLCFFLDEKKGSQISYVQYPQRFNNLTKNDIYANAARTTFQIELAGIDGFGGALYIGTGCFHRRESLMGKSYGKDHCIIDAKDYIITKTIEELEEASKPLANCSYEKGTLWGKEMGLVYGFPVEDIVTGLTIQCRGWKPVYYNPEKNAFEGLGVTTLDTELVQFKRWSEGMFQIFCSKYCPFVYGHGKIPLGAQMGYCIYLLWAPLSFPMLCYAVVPALYLIQGVPLFPKASSLWFFPFAYVYVARTIYSLLEDVHCGDTVKAWWNLQRMTFLRRVGAFLFAFFDTVTRQLGLSETTFAITDKVMDEELQKRFKNEVLEFGGSSSIIFVIIATIAVLNLVSFVYGIKRAVVPAPELLPVLLPQLIVSGMIVLVNLPVYEALFFRKDKGSLPSMVLFKSIAVVLFIVCLIPSTIY